MFANAIDIQDNIEQCYSDKNSMQSYNMAEHRCHRCNMRNIVCLIFVGVAFVLFVYIVKRTALALK